MTRLETTIKKLERLATKQILIEGYDLERIRAFMAYLGNPQESYKIIHVTGTSGKGSTAKFIAAILSGQGFKVGAYYSPHITTPCERIELNGNVISDSDFCKLFDEIYQSYRVFFKGKSFGLTYFEYLLAMAFVYFAHKKIDVLVLEVGLGGKLDPTNIVSKSLAVITNVGLDHTRILGDTIEKIISDKVQIVKPGCLCVSGLEQTAAVSIVENYCKSSDAKLVLLGRDFQVADIVADTSGTSFSYIDAKHNIQGVKLGMLGAHQAYNAGIAIAAVLNFLDSAAFSEERLKMSLQSVRFPGRIEVISNDPLIIWDGAHNEDKMHALVTTLRLFAPRKILLLFAFKKGQNKDALIRQLSLLQDLVEEVVLTQYKVTQDLEIESEQAQHFIQQVQRALPMSKVMVMKDPYSAYIYLSRKTSPTNMLVVTGSFYLLASLTALLHRYRPRPVYYGTTQL